MVLARKNVGIQKDSWCTPKWLFDLLDKEFNFDIDVACTLENCLCQTGFTIEQNSLVQDWGNTNIYMNPPYSGGQINEFMKKAYEQSMEYHDATIVGLVPVFSDTQWWHKYVMQSQEIRFIEGRVDYIGYDNEGKRILQSPTFPSCVVIFDKHLEDTRRIDLPCGLDDVCEEGYTLEEGSACSMGFVRCEDVTRPLIGPTIKKQKKVK